MLTQTFDAQQFVEKVRRIRACAPTALAQWGLYPPRLKDYFTPRLPLDLAIDLNAPVVSAVVGTDFQRALGLAHGHLSQLPTGLAPGLAHSQLLVGLAYAPRPMAVVWGRPIIVVDMTELNQPNFEYQDYPVEADFQIALLDAPVSAALPFEQLPTLSASDPNSVSVVVIPTALVQVAAPSNPLPEGPKNLPEPNATALVHSRSALMLRIRLMLGKYNDL